MPVVLALDAAGLVCSAAVTVGDAITYAERLACRFGQAEQLLPMVDRALRRAGLQPTSLDFIAVTLGPGSFTGIRIGLAAAKGIALATGTPLIGVTSFEAAAVAFTKRDDLLLVALESRREELYVQLFDPRCDPVSQPAAMSPLALADFVNATIGTLPLVVVGDAAQRAGMSLSERADTTILENSAADAISTSRAALRRLARGKESGTARPLYLTPPAVTLRGEHRKPDLARV